MRQYWQQHRGLRIVVIGLLAVLIVVIGLFVTGFIMALTGNQYPPSFDGRAALHILGRLL